MYDVLRANFDAAYEGNRAPFPIYVHRFWLTTKDNAKDLQRFAGGCRPARPCRQRKHAPVLQRRSRCPSRSGAKGCLAASGCLTSCRPPMLCRLCAEQARHLLCHDAAADCLDAAPSARRQAHACQAGLRQSGRRGAGGVVSGAAATSALDLLPQTWHQTPCLFFVLLLILLLSSFYLMLAVLPEHMNGPGGWRQPPAGASRRTVSRRRRIRAHQEQVLEASGVL